MSMGSIFSSEWTVPIRPQNDLPSACVRLSFALVYPFGYWPLLVAIWEEEAEEALCTRLVHMGAGLYAGWGGGGAVIAGCLLE